MNAATKRVAVALLLLWRLSPSSAGADERRDFLRKGSSEWGITGNVGIAHDVWGGVPDMEFLSVAGRFGRVMTEPRGPGFLRGRLALNVEASPVFLIFQERSTYGFNGVVQGRHYLEVGARVTPFISLGFGFLVTDKQTPPGTARLNFTPQVGGGIAIQGTEDRVFTVEYRLHHISNGSRANRNPGVNSSVFQFGISFPLRKPISE